MIVVIDTNVWVSALVFSKPGSVPRQVLDRVLLHDKLATSRELRDEIYRILTDRCGWRPKRAAALLTHFQSDALIVPLQHTVHVCRDPKDGMFLECAALAKADAIVTGDKDLLSLGMYADTRIITTREYLALPRG